MRRKVGPKETSVKRLPTDPREHTHEFRKRSWSDAIVMESSAAQGAKDASVEFTFRESTPVQPVR